MGLALTVTKAARAAARALLFERRAAASVEGIFDGLIERAGRPVVVVNDRTGRAVTCTFQDALQDEILALRSGTRVVAWGRLQRDSDGQKVELDLWGIEQVALDPPPAVDDLIGIFGSGWKGAMSSVEWVRAQRES